MLNFPSGGGKWSSLSGQAPGGGAAAADGMARIKAKLDELDRVMLEGRRENGRRLQEQQRVTLLAEVGYKATELSKVREQLVQAQQRKVLAEERLRAHEIICQVQQTIEDAFVCTGRKPGAQEHKERV
ncbi:Hypothetical protein NocV09_01301540 [Nannochloropsis oceanica]